MISVRWCRSIQFPKIAFVDERQHWMYVQEVLLDKVIQNRSRGHPETALHFQITDVLRKHILDVSDIKKRVVGVKDVDSEQRTLLPSPLQLLGPRFCDSMAMLMCGVMLLGTIRRCVGRYMVCRLSIAQSRARGVYCGESRGGTSDCLSLIAGALLIDSRV